MVLLCRLGDECLPNPRRQDMFSSMLEGEQENGLAMLTGDPSLKYAEEMLVSAGERSSEETKAGYRLGRNGRALWDETSVCRTSRARIPAGPTADAVSLQRPCGGATVGQGGGGREGARQTARAPDGPRLPRSDRKEVHHPRGPLHRQSRCLSTSRVACAAAERAAVDRLALRPMSV